MKHFSDEEYDSMKEYEYSTTRHSEDDEYFRKIYED